MRHIVDGTTTSPFLSLTKSYGVAYGYAVDASRATPSKRRPAYVYEIEIEDPIPTGLKIFDPICELAKSFPPPTASITYHHNGDGSYLLGVVDPKLHAHHLSRCVRQPPPCGGTPVSASLSRQLQTMVRALRDAEIIVEGKIPAATIRYRYEVW